MNVSDLLYSVLTGSWRHDRALVREQTAFNAQTRPVREMLVKNHRERMRLYAGAEPGLNRPYPNQLSTPEDWKQAYERIVLIRAARQLEEDGGFFDGILDDFETYVVGEELKWLPNTGNPKADAVIRDYLEPQFDQADHKQQFSLTKLAQLAVRSLKRDGECGFIPVDVGDAIKLRGYSGDCIGNPLLAQPAGSRDFNGIVVNEEDQPVLFRLWKRLPKLNAYTFDREVEADNFWHYFDPFRMQQFHGVSVFKNAIEDGFDIDQILEFTKLNIKYRASQLPSVHTETGKPRGPQNGPLSNWIPGNGPGGGAIAPGGPATAEGVNVDGVRMTYFNLNEKVMEYPNDFPNAQLSVSIEEFRRQCCKGAKLPYEFVYRADNGGVVQRFWVDKARNTFGRDKYWLRRSLLNPYKNRSLKKGVETGELDLRSFGDLDVSLELYRGQWRMGSTISVDYGRETDADLKQIEAGLYSPVDYAAENNRDLDEVRSEIVGNAEAFIAAGQELAIKTGLSFDQVMPFLVKKWPNPPAVIGTGKADAPPAETPEQLAAKSERITMNNEIQSLRLKAERLESATLHRPPPAPAPAPNITVNNAPAPVTVHLPATKFEPAQVKVEHHSHLAASPAPVVNIAPPNVSIGAPAAPQITVNVPPAPAPIVNVNVPPLKATLTLDRGADGKLSGGAITDSGKPAAK